MGFIDDAASVLSTRSSHSKKSRSHRSKSHRSHSRSRSRSRAHHSSAAPGLGGIAASIFGGDNSDSDKSHHRKSKKHHSSRSFFGTDDYKKHSSSKASFFGLPNGSRSSFFNFSASGGKHSPSYYKRSPRPNFVSRVIRRLKRLLRDLIYYAKRHPLKVFMLVIMPLITGGFLTALLAKFGLRLPASITKMMGIASKAATGESIGLVGEAVRMASGAGIGTAVAGGITKASTSIERGRDGDFQWERKSLAKDYIPGGGSSSSSGAGWGESFAGIAKMFS